MKTGKRFFKAFEKSTDEAGQLLRKSEDFTGSLFDAEVNIFKDYNALTDLTVKI